MLSLSLRHCSGVSGRASECASAETYRDCALDEHQDMCPAEIVRHRHVGDRFTIMAVEREGNLHDLAIPARELKPAAAPPLVGAIAANEARVRATGPLRVERGSF